MFILFNRSNIKIILILIKKVKLSQWRSWVSQDLCVRWPFTPYICLKVVFLFFYSMNIVILRFYGIK